MLTYQFFNAVPKIEVSNGEFRICCPECDDDNFHLYVNTTKEVFHCFKCEYGGRIKKEIIGGSTDLSRFEQKVSQYLRTVPLNGSEEYVTQLIGRTLPPSKHITLNAEDNAPRNYLYQRGITWDDIRNYQIHYSKEHNSIYRDMVIFPIEPKWGQFPNQHLGVGYFVCRRITNEEPKYINAPWEKKDTIFLIDNKGPYSGCLVIVEGIIDAITIAKYGFSVCALLGKKANADQLVKIKSLNYSKYLIYLDVDALAQAVKLKSYFHNSALVYTSMGDANYLHNYNSQLLKETLENEYRHLSNKKSEM